MRYLLCSLLFVLASFYKADATNLSGTISNDTTLTVANSPYHLVAKLTLMQGYTLTIEPGVEIIVDSNCMIEIRGKLVVNGTPAAHVSIHHNNTSIRYGWQGLSFVDFNYPMHAQAYVNYCDISNATACEYINSSGATGPYTYRHCSFTTSVKLNGSSGSSTRVLFDSCLIKNNLVGLDYNQSGGMMTNCIIDSNDVGLDGGDSIINCTFINNNLAIKSFSYLYNCDIHYNNAAMQSSFSGHFFINNKVKRNNTGIEAKGFTNTVFSGNQLCDNGPYDFYVNTADTCNIPNTCWCASDSAYIQSRIKDGHTVTGKGLAKFLPVDTNCNTIPPPPPVIVGSMENIQPVFYPNPAHANGGVHIKMNTSADDKFIITDLIGKKLDRTPHMEQCGYMLNIEGLQTGTYFITIVKGDRKETQRLVVIE